MVRIDVGRYLEDEAGELGFVGRHHPLLCLRGLWVGRNLDKAVEQLLYTEVVERRTEEYGGHFGLAVVVDAKCGVDAVDEVEVVAQSLGKVLTDMLLEVGRRDVNFHLLRLALLVGREEVEVVLVDVVHTLELHALSNRPGEGAYMDM